MRVMCVGAILYAAGLFLMSHATAPLSLDIGAGVLIGFGLSGCSFNLVLSAFSKLLPPERRGKSLRRASPIDLAGFRADAVVVES